MLSPLTNTIVKGAIGVFEEQMAQALNIWENYAQKINSDGSKETHAFVGHVPEPAENTGGERDIKQILDYKFDIENSAWEVTLAIPRDDFNDQQVQRINMRFAEIGRVYGSFKDKQFKDLLQNNAAPPINNADNITWTTFFGTGTFGDSSTLDNDISTNITTTNDPTTDEFKTAIKNAIKQLRTMEDDVGRPNHNDVAMTQLRLLVPPEHEFAAKEAVNATVISNTTNVLNGIATVDVMNYLTTDTTYYLAAVGDITKPIIMQDREPLELIIDMDPKAVARRGAVYVMARERYQMKAGDPRRIIRDVFS